MATERSMMHDGITIDYFVTENGEIFVSMDELIDSLSGYVAEYSDDPELDAQSMVLLLAYIRGGIKNDQSIL